MPLRALGNWYFRGPAFGDPQQAFQRLAPQGLLEEYTPSPEQQAEMGRQLQSQLRSWTPRSQIIQPFQQGLLAQQQAGQQQQMVEEVINAYGGLLQPYEEAAIRRNPDLIDDIVKGFTLGQGQAQFTSYGRMMAQRDPTSVLERDAQLERMSRDPDYLANVARLQAAEGGPLSLGSGVAAFDPVTGERIAAQPTQKMQEAAAGLFEEDPSTGAMRTRQAMIEDYMRNNPGMTYNQAADLHDRMISQTVDPTSGRTSAFNPRQFVMGDPGASRFVQPAQPLGGYEPPPWTQGGASLGTEGAIPSTGIAGAAKTLVNQIAGSIGAGEPFPETAQFIAVADRLRTDSTMRMAEGFAGRPSNFVVQKWDSLSADPRKIMQGDEALYRDLREFRSLVERDRSMTEDIARDPYSVDVKTHQDALLKLRNLNDVAADYDAILELMEAVMSSRGMTPRARSGAQEGIGVRPPAAGEVIDGWEFMGGDPGNQANWRRTQ